MGKYMRKRRGAGKVAVMDVSQGALGVRTRAKTLALVEQDRKLAIARCANLKLQQTSVVDPLHSTYLELRNRKLEKFVKEIERPVSCNFVGEDRLNEGEKNLLKVNSCNAAEVVECATRPTVDEGLLYGEVVGSARPSESANLVDDCKNFEELPIEMALRSRATIDGSQLRCSGSREEPSLLDNVPLQRRSGEFRAHEAVQGGVLFIDDGLSHGGLSFGLPEVDVSWEHASVDLGISSARRSNFGNPVGTCRDREGCSHADPVSSTRAGFLGDRHDRRMANHSRIMIQNRRYLRTNLFNDAKAIDDFFAAPDTTDREVGRKFTERYNYDVVNDKPLEGRFEWIPAAEACNTTTPTTQYSTDLHQPLSS